MTIVITATCAGFSKTVCAPKLELITGRSGLFDIEIDSIARISSSAGRDVSRDAVPRSVELPQTGANDRVQPVVGSAVCGSRARRGCEFSGRPGGSLRTRRSPGGRHRRAGARARARAGPCGSGAPRGAGPQRPRDHPPPPHQQAAGMTAAISFVPISPPRGAHDVSGPLDPRRRGPGWRASPRPRAPGT